MWVKRWFAAIAVVALVGVTAGSASAATRPWRIVKTPALGTGMEMLGVSCPTATFCMAVGQSGGTAAAKWDGTEWSTVPTVDPSGTFADWLTDISCVSSDFCVAVGERFSSQAGNDPTLIETWNGTSWSLTDTSALTSEGGLNGVACTSTTACVAVGGGPIAALWDGVQWTASTVPAPSAFGGDLEDISCPSPSACVAVGTYNTAPNAQGTLVESWDGSAWTQSQSPSPGIDPNLTDVSCASTTACLAVGVTRDNDDHYQPLAEVFRRHHWTVTATPDAPTPGIFDSVSCARPTWCVVVGDRTGPVNAAILDVWNGSTWTVPSFSAPRADNELLGTTCIAVQSCVAVGVSNTGKRPFKAHPLVETDMKRVAAS
ncbi:MAG TPA: hypothetical protein VH914_10140 [Acidimicrobiia bacterium]|jgi:hypothetical protein|nr:hypothetical protein [Acidimicrobiia bacterium]